MSKILKFLNSGKDESYNLIFFIFIIATVFLQLSYGIFQGSLKSEEEVRKDRNNLKVAEELYDKITLANLWLPEKKVTKEEYYNKVAEFDYQIGTGHYNSQILFVLRNNLKIESCQIATYKVNFECYEKALRKIGLNLQYQSIDKGHDSNGVRLIENTLKNGELNLVGLDKFKEKKFQNSIYEAYLVSDEDLNKSEVKINRYLELKGYYLARERKDFSEGIYILVEREKKDILAEILPNSGMFIEQGFLSFGK